MLWRVVLDHWLPAELRHVEGRMLAVRGNDVRLLAHVPRTMRQQCGQMLRRNCQLSVHAPLLLCAHLLDFSKPLGSFAGPNQW